MKMHMTFLEKQIEMCIEDGARRSHSVPRNSIDRYCGLQQCYNENECPFAGEIRVFDIGTLGIQRYKEVYECLYKKKEELTDD